MEPESIKDPIEDPVAADPPVVSGVEKEKVPEPGGTFKCSYCSLEEHYEYKGRKPPFARQIKYLEDCYMAEDPMSLPKTGEVLVFGGDCSICEKAVCLDCSLFYTKRFCKKCCNDNTKHFPAELHAKIRKLNEETQ